VLLFGEHLINRGAMGFATPVSSFGGVLRLGEIRNPRVGESNKAIELLANHIVYDEALAPNYNTNQLLEDIERGLYFDSDIPTGYGLGSSGALVAAIFNQYFLYKKKNFVLSETKEHLALLESYFHGKSSGLDALVSFLNKSVLINNGQVAEAFSMKPVEEPKIKVYLVDSGTARRTGDFVNLFFEKCTQTKFNDIVTKSMLPANNMAIDGLLKHNYGVLWNSLKLLSQLQLDNMSEFIPKHLYSGWENGLRSNEYMMKICGAGGGGFSLCFAHPQANISFLLPNSRCIPIMDL